MKLCSCSVMKCAAVIIRRCCTRLVRGSTHSRKNTDAGSAREPGMTSVSTRCVAVSRTRCAAIAPGAQNGSGTRVPPPGPSDCFLHEPLGCCTYWTFPMMTCCCPPCTFTATRLGAWLTNVVVTLRDVQGLDYRAIAEITGTPIGTVESRIFRARQRLKKELGAKGESL